MSILEKMNKAIEEIDVTSMEEILHDNFEFYFHSSQSNKCEIPHYNH